MAGERPSAEGTLPKRQQQDVNRMSTKGFAAAAADDSDA
eukprot:CAMPEP_0171262924 /NCGR_PEP_ID=MMETSP0790-20130122/56822_1 /TAXON_ID=2925 /ORGANISM="Alexandrium catenella, Strain OF101" /LENGTH=38 /DNA_ID= /DNA_START= /DNA_END= /DNA_ORIENTATION=